MRALPLVVLVMVVAGCGDSVGPAVSPPQAVEMDPLPEYAEWYSGAELCSGLDGSFRSARWFMVPDDVEWIADNDERRAGLWDPDFPDHIYVAERNVADSIVVTHWIGHHIIQSERHPIALAPCVPSRGAFD